MQNVLFGRVVLPQQLARVAVQTHQRRRVRFGNVDVALVHAVAGLHEQSIADDQRRAVRRVVREHLLFLDEVVLPDDVGVGLGVVLLVLETLVAVREAVHVQAHHAALITDVIDAIPNDRGRRTHAEVRPVSHTADGQGCRERPARGTCRSSRRSASARPCPPAPAGRP